jgi:hypothetical protein
MWLGDWEIDRSRVMRLSLAIITGKRSGAEV